MIQEVFSWGLLDPLSNLSGDPGSLTLFQIYLVIQEVFSWGLLDPFSNLCGDPGGFGVSLILFKFI